MVRSLDMLCKVSCKLSFIFPWEVRPFSCTLISFIGMTGKIVTQKENKSCMHIFREVGQSRRLRVGHVRRGQVMPCYASAAAHNAPRLLRPDRRVEHLSQCYPLRCRILTTSNHVSSIIYTCQKYNFNGHSAKPNSSTPVVIAVGLPAVFRQSCAMSKRSRSRPDIPMYLSASRRYLCRACYA